MKHISLQLLIIIGAIAAPEMGHSRGHPNIFLNTDEIHNIRKKLNQEPWNEAYKAIISRADYALELPEKSVTFQGSTANIYHTEGAYDWSNNMPGPCGRRYCDGRINPKSERGDYTAAIAVSRAIVELGLAYAFTHDSRYAEKVIGLIDTWCLNPATAMPPMYPGKQSKIELSITMPAIFYGADLIYSYENWNAKGKAAFLQWVTDFAASALKWRASNNFENWRLVVISSAGALTDNRELLDYAFARWKEIIPMQVTTDGKMKQETERSKSLDYSMYAINAMIQTAEIARHSGIDLYNYKDASNRGLELVLDYHAPFVANPSSWKYQQISEYKGANAAVLECAYLWKQKPAYLDAISNWGRPLDETRIMNLVTLTHAFDAYPWRVFDTTP